MWHAGGRFPAAGLLLEPWRRSDFSSDSESSIFCHRSAGVFRFAFFTVPPGTSKIPESTDLPAAFAEIQSKLPAMVEVLEPLVGAVPS